MNFLIFAGGAGTRLWPLSRKNTPKQFTVKQNDRSTLQLAVDRISTFGADNIFISTNEQYVPLVHEQLPAISLDHIFSEPARRDLAAAVCLSLVRLKKQGVKGTIAVLWSDHFMDHPDRFVTALDRANALIQIDPDRFVFFGEKPRFANHNLGWIHIGEEIRKDEHAFLGWKYRPEKNICESMFASGEWLWNPGYFVFDIDFVLSLYKEHHAEMLGEIESMVRDEKNELSKYANLPAESFDRAIVEHVRPEQAVVLKVDLGWSDPGTLYALKEAMVGGGHENYIQGTVVMEDSKDSFVYNEDPHKLVATLGVEGILVINTKDGLLVCPKDRVTDLPALLKRLDAEGFGKHL